MQTAFSKPGKFWRGNLHTHSTGSDGRCSPEEVCRRYREVGYDFLALTDHFLAEYNWPLTDTRPFRAKDFTTIIGAEIHTNRMELGNSWHIVAAGLPLDFAPTRPDETGPELARRALDAGAFVAAAHPQWFAMTEGDMLALGPVHAIEIYNASAADDNDTAESVYLLDLMLARGHRYNAIATDDAHFIPNSREHFSGWVMVKSEELSPESLLAALKAGDYYSSTGLEITRIEVVPDDHVYVECSPATRVFAIGIPTEYTSVGALGITEARLSLKNWRSPYVRILARDDTGRKAWSNPIWLK
jgi:hypothetical protein